MTNEEACDRCGKRFPRHKLRNRTYLLVCEDCCNSQKPILL